MRPHTGQQQHQQSHQQQQYSAVDNCLKQQQNFSKNHHNLQQQQASALQQQQNYHQHHLQQHVLQQQQQQSLPPTSHMWNPHLSAACFSSQAPTANPNNVSSSINPNNIINLQNCPPFAHNRAYQHPTHPSHYPHCTGYSHAMPATSPGVERMPLTAPNYAKLPPLTVVNQQRINECAGIPLISTASAHLTPRHRISRKQSHSPPGKNWSNILPGNAAQNYPAAAHYGACHIQGSPSMLNKQAQQKPEYWSPNAYGSSNTHQQQVVSNALQYTNRQHNINRTPLRYQNSAPASLTSSKCKENLEQQLKHIKDNENSSSNNGDSSNCTETCLPRIIKPRKRRKKDRKPPSNLVNAGYLKMDHKTLHDKSSNTNTNTIKSRKSPEDLLKSLLNFSQIRNLSDQPERTNKTGPIFEISAHNSERATHVSQLTTAVNNINHGICFCNECDPLRSLWDYPLRRSLSDSSASDTSGTSSICDNNSTSSEYSWPKARAEIVGVIGSKRNKDLQNRSYNNNLVNSVNIIQDNNLFNNNILSGINISTELFKSSNCSTLDNLDNALIAPNNMFLLPETAETLLTKSINEISKKLIETCSNETFDLPLSSCHSVSSFSTTSSNSSSANSTCADFSNDSGIESAHINAGDDLVFNFDNLHITTTKLSLLPSSSSSASLSSSSCSSSSNSSCNNLSMSSSPTAKFTSTFLTTQSSTSTTAASVLASAPTMQQITTPLTTANNVVMGTTIKAAPTLDFLVDLNNNHLHVAPQKAMIASENEQLQQQQQQQKARFNDLLHNHQPPQQQLQTAASRTIPTRIHQHDKQFFNNCFDLMWQQNERQLGNNINTTTNTTSILTSTSTNTLHTVNNNNNNNNNNNRNSIDQLTSSDLTSNNVAMSSFFETVGSLKTVFSTIS